MEGKAEDHLERPVLLEMKNKGRRVKILERKERGTAANSQ